MKAFVASICIIAVFTGLIIANAIYINKVADDLILATNDVKMDTGCEKLRSLWESKRLIISLCANHKEIDKIQEQIALMENAIKKDDPLELKRAMVLFIEYTNNIKRHEELTLDNIL